MKIAIFTFDNFTALDVIGPYKLLTKLPGSEICFVDSEIKEYKDPYEMNIAAS